MMLLPANIASDVVEFIHIVKSQKYSNFNLGLFELATVKLIIFFDYFASNRN